ncbi:hypothetical protein [Neolewinella persica]|nr:hypothetical protein [Neolewinella persica]
MTRSFGGQPSSIVANQPMRDLVVNPDIFSHTFRSIPKSRYL